MSSTKQLFSLAKLELSAQDDPLEFSGIKSQEKTAYTKRVLYSIEDFEVTFEGKPLLSVVLLILKI